MAVTGTEATVVWAKRRGSKGDAEAGESDWLTDVIGHRFGKTVWIMELEVHPVDGVAYRVQDEFKVPNKLFKLRHMNKGQPRFSAGLALPVLVDPNEMTKVSIDWGAFEAAGGVGKLYGEDEKVVDTVRDFVAELRSAPVTPEPDLPRPTPATHPPVEGVDYDQWVRAVLEVVRRMDPAALDAHYQSHGFPPGRGDEISKAWYDRVQKDPVVNAWYLYDQAAR